MFHMKFILHVIMVYHIVRSLVMLYAFVLTFCYIVCEMDLFSIPNLLEP